MLSTNYTVHYQIDTRIQQHNYIKLILTKVTKFNSYNIHSVHKQKNLYQDHNFYKFHLESLTTHLLFA